MAGQFTLDISQFVEKAKGNIDLVVRKISLDMFTRVILRSPVDTGRFRGNWQVAIGRIPDNALDLTDASGSATVSRATAEALKVKGGDTIYLVNNLPYGPALETGHSKAQAPAGMIGVTVVEFQQVVNKAATEVKSGKT